MRNMLTTTQTQTEGDNMTIKVGDKVVYNNTDYEPVVMKGDVGVITHVHEDGFAYIDVGDGLALSAFGYEYTKLDETIAVDTPTIWRDMTDAEKGALLLAKHEGAEIEHKIFPKGDVDYEWCVSPDTSFSGNHAYRIKPTPKVETVALCYRKDVEYAKNRIGTINLIDGKPDIASIKMEEL